MHGGLSHRQEQRGRQVIDDGMALARAVESHTDTLRQFAGSEAHKVMAALLSALELTYKEELVSVQPDQLISRQTAIRQVVALRRAIEAGSLQSPRI